MRIVTAEEMRQIDREAVAKGISTDVLMANAGRAVAEATRDWYGDVNGKEILVLVGPGNNGGDGLVAARHFHDWGAKVTLYLWGRRTEGDVNFAETQRRAIRFFCDDEERLPALVARADIIIDALLGTGKTRPIAGTLKRLLKHVAQAKKPDAYVVAVDLPTGLDADTGALDDAALPADLTVTLGYPKPGLFLLPGAGAVGRLSVADIGLPREPEGEWPLEMITPQLVKRHLPKRPAVAHKGTFGKVMIIAGSVNYVGAPALACIAAGRVGAGLVTLACGNQIYSIVAAKLFETTFLPLPDTPPGVLRGEAVDIVSRAAIDYDVILLGPGIGQHPATFSFVEQLLRWARAERTGRLAALAWIIDADGLNALCKMRRWPELVPQNAVLTPHPAEMARLLGSSVETVQSDRLSVARRAALEWRRVVVLKGANTIVAAPDGQTFINPCANPALATAGTGDVLAGAIAGFLAQGLEAKWAAVVGVFIHGLAGDIARDDIGEAGVLAGDLLNLLPEAINVTKADPPRQLVGDERYL